MIKGQVGSFLINETKLDESFTSIQFAMSDYKFTRSKFGSGMAFYATDQFPRWTVKIEYPSDIEILTIEITISKIKILVAGIHKPSSLSETDFTTNLETITSELSNKYEKLILMGAFNITTSNTVLSQFLDTFALSP